MGFNTKARAEGLQDVATPSLQKLSPVSTATSGSLTDAIVADDSSKFHRYMALSNSTVTRASYVILVSIVSKIEALQKCQSPRLHFFRSGRCFCNWMMIERSRELRATKFRWLSRNTVRQGVFQNVMFINVKVCMYDIAWDQFNILLKTYLCEPVFLWKNRFSYQR